MVLAEAERAELHGAIVEYLRVQKLPEDVVTSVETQLRGGPGSRRFADTDAALEKRWNTLRRLATKLTELEAQNKQMEAQLREATDPTVVKASARDALPGDPALAVFRGHRDAVSAVCFHPFEPLAYSASEDGSVRVWDTKARTHVQTIREHSDNVACLALEPIEARMLASGGNDQTVKLCDALSGECQKTLHGHDAGVTALAWVGDQNRSLLSGDREGNVKAWDTRNGGLLSSWRHDGWVRSLALPRLGAATVACAGNDCVVTLWQWRNGTPQSKWAAHTNVIQTAAFSSYETDVVIIEAHGSQDQREVLKAFQRRLAALRATEGASGTVVGASFSSVGVVAGAAVAASNGSAHPSSSSAALLASYEPRFVATGARDKLILITDIVTKATTLTFNDHENWIRQLAFSHNGRFLVSCSDDGNVLVLDLGTKRVHRRIVAHEHFVTALALHPALKPLALTGCADGTVKLWPCH